MNKQQRYNLPGFGYVRVRLFPTAKYVFTFLDNYDHLQHLKSIDHLGPIRQVLPGAHHTRYEYLMAQLSIITELCHLSGQLPAGLSLTRDRNTFGEISDVSSTPSNGEILMILALLGNIGHLPSTFSGERALMKYLRDHGPARSTFRTGLPAEDRTTFDSIISNNKLYKFNYLIASFLLNRYKRRKGGHDVADLCHNIIRSFNNEDSTDQSLIALWGLYRNIRRLTYLALDSHYAPVPFSLDLGSIFFSLDYFLTDVFSQGSAFQNALIRLEGVMRDTVYMGSAQLINHARVGDEILNSLEATNPVPTTIGAFWDMLGPDRNVDDVFQIPPVDGTNLSDESAIVEIAFDLDPSLATNILPDPIAWERSARKAAGLRSCLFAADFDPPLRHLKICASLTPGLEDSVRRKAGLRIAKQLLDLEKKIVESEVSLSAAAMTSNGLNLLRFLLPQLLGPKHSFRLRTLPAVDKSPVIRLYGSTKAADYVNEYGAWADRSGLVSKDELNEVYRLEEALRKVDYRGAVIAFVGSTEVIYENKLIAEFDGLVLMLSRETTQPSVIVVEAKNKVHGHTEAENQLEDRLHRLGLDQDAYDISHLGTKGAMAKLTLE